MSKLKGNRPNIFIVTRGDSVIGAFSQFEEADNYCAAMEQEFFEKAGDYSKEPFKVQMTPFYG